MDDELSFRTINFHAIREQVLRTVDVVDLIEDERIRTREVEESNQCRDDDDDG